MPLSHNKEKSGRSKHKGVENKFLKPHEWDSHIAEGWVKGRKIHTRPPAHKGKIRITNGTRNSYLLPGHDMPTGWWRGKVDFIARYGIKIEF